MQNSSSRKYEHRKKTKERSLKRRKAKSSDLWNSKNDPLDLENPDSRLTKTNIKNILTEQVFKTLPPADQSKLVQLLPTCDRLLAPDSDLSVGQEALNNEFFAKACIEWKERLADGDFTAETQVRCKLEREKRLHVDPWKKKYFESFWGEKLTTLTTTSMTVSSPILATSVQPSVPERRPLLADLLTKVVPSPHSTAATSVSSQRVREQLTLMLNNKSLHPMKAFNKVGLVASGTVATTVAAAAAAILPNRTVQQLDSTLHCKTSENSGPSLVQICLAKNYARSVSGQPSNNTVKPALGTAVLGKRTLDIEDRSNSRPVKKSLIGCKELLSRPLDISYIAKSDGSNPKSESAASLMPVLASALLTNDNVSSTASSSSCIPTVVLMQKSGMTSQGITMSKNQVAGLGHSLRPDLMKPSVQKELNNSMSASSRGAASLREELTSKLEAQSNRVKKNLFMSEDSTPKYQDNFHKHIEKLAVLVSEKESGAQGRVTVGSQVILPPSDSVSVSSHLLSSSPLNSLIMSNASFLSATSGPKNISNILMAPSFLQQPSPCLDAPPGSRDAFQIFDTSVNPASAAPKCVFPFLASQGETFYIVQQPSSSSAVAKPLPPAVAFPNQTPLILVLANPSLQGMALASGLLPQASFAAGAPKVAINTQPLELALGNHSGSTAPVVITQASQTMIPSQTIVVGNKAVVNHAFQTFTYASQTPQSFTVASQTTKTLVVGSSPSLTFSNRTSLNCGGIAGTRAFTVLNHGLQKLESVSPAGMAETMTPRQPNSTSVGLSARPMFFGNQARERFVLANLSANQTSQMLNVANTHLKDNMNVNPLTTYNPRLDNQAVANQIPQLLVAISGASPQILCAAKNSGGPLPVLSQLSFKAASTPPKIGPGSICMLRRPSPTANLQASSMPSVRCCNILPTPGGVQSASTPMILLQALSKATAPPSENLASLAIPTPVASFSSMPRSSLIAAPSQQQPFVFQVVPENNVHTVDPQNPQRLTLNTMPLNGGLGLKMQLDCNEQTNVDNMRSSCNASTISKSICNPVALGKSTHLLNGSRVKTITIKKLTPPVGHAASSTTGQGSSLIKTLLTNREPEQVLFLSSDNHDILNSMLHVGQNAYVIRDSTREMQQDGAGVEICKSCGSVLDRRSSSGEAWNSVGVCSACHSSV